MIDLPKFNIGNLKINLIQGGMGVKISARNLASAVANCGGAGIIAGVGLGFSKNYPGIKYSEYNAEALREEILATREMSPKGVIGVNIMRALTDYRELVKTASKENIDLIISGAGMPTDLPKLVENPNINLIPIISSLKAAKVITRAWRRYNRNPDAFIIEGPEAGGHLGFKFEDLKNKTTPKLEDITKEVIDFANNPLNFENKIPVIVAGGIYTGQDIFDYHKLGAAGVQMATRFVTTKECDAEEEFKRTYLNSSEEDIILIKSPVGMPGRAIKNSFLEKITAGEKIKFNCKYNCLKTCNPKESPYCIAKSLVDAQKGYFDEGFVFAGSNAYRATPENSLDSEGNFITVKTLMENLSREYRLAK